MGIMGDILDVTADGGRDGIIVSAISRKANLSHYAVLDKCEKLVEAGLVESIKTDRNRVFQITEKGLQFFQEFKRFQGLALKVARGERIAVVGQPVAEKERVLRHAADGGPEIFPRVIVDVLPVDEDVPFRNPVEPKENMNQRAFPRTGFSDHSDPLPARNFQGDVPKSGRPVLRIIERQIPDFDLAGF